MFLWRNGENYPRIFYKHSSLSSPLLIKNISSLKTPRKPASENVACLSSTDMLANFQTYFCIQTNSVDPNQTAPIGSLRVKICTTRALSKMLFFKL